jgi:hypothetical protein
VCVFRSGWVWPGGAGVWLRGAILLVRAARPFHVKTSGSARLRPTCRLLPLGSVPSMRQTVCARFFCCDNDTRAPALVGYPCQPRCVDVWPSRREGQEGFKSFSFQERRLEKAECFSLLFLQDSLLLQRPRELDHSSSISGEHASCGFFESKLPS